MRICIIAEGSYPYITGGVSSWIHSLMTNLPEFEFVIHSIGASREQQGQFKYQLPPNAVDVQETFLDEMLDEAGGKISRTRLDPAKKDAFLSLLSGEKHVDWAGIFALLRSEQFQKAPDFLMSRDYFDVLTQLCAEKYSQIPFTEMVWTVRSMVLPLFSSVREEIPQADLYHSVSTGYAGVIGALAKYLYNKPLLLTEHGIYSREREEEIIKADWVKGYFKDLWIDYFYRLSGCAYDYADQVITLFNRNREIEIELGCQPEKISIIPNGVRLPASAEPSYEVLPAAPHRIRIGAVVRIVPIKDIKTMIHSFALVKQQVPEAELYIMGPADENDEYHEECKQLVESLQTEDIIFTGEVRVSDYLPHMDIVLLSSVSEGMPLAVMEAMSYSKPVVATDVGSCRELLEGREDEIGPAGLIVPVMHYEQMADAVVKLCGNRKLREQMGQSGFKRISKKYRHESFINSYRGLYTTMGGGKSWQASASN